MPPSNGADELEGPPITPALREEVERYNEAWSVIEKAELRPYNEVFGAELFDWQRRILRG